MILLPVPGECAAETLCDPSPRRAKREADRQKRIDQEGWDKFAPITKTNHPPGYDLSLIK